MHGNITTFVGLGTTLGTVGSMVYSAAQLQAANGGNGNEMLEITNPSATATISFSFTNPNPVLNGPGTATLLPGTTKSYNGYNGSVPLNPLYAVASAAGTPITVNAG